MRLEGKIAVVTGAGQTRGRALAMVGRQQSFLHGKVQNWCWQIGVSPRWRKHVNFCTRKGSTLNA